VKATIRTENSHLLVTAGKSSRLDAIRKKAEKKISGSEVNEKPKHQIFVPGTNQVIKQALQQAQLIIDTRIQSILKAYPAGKKNTFFKLKYAVSAETLKKQLINDIFKKLELDTKKIKNFNLIEKLYLDGKAADAQ